MRRRAFIWAVLLAGVALLPSCGPDLRTMPIHDVDLKAVPEGTHEGSFAYGGFTHVVRTTVEGGRIVKIDLVKNRTNEYAKKAEAVLPRVIEKQTPNVDAITGATMSSKALLKAVENSLTVRGG